ncbi:hypothetical protein BHE74_00023010 [Ensete ventricosum]|nr:hypothetical protein BHE74_00023010 [Ensete ventricosum]
MIVRYPLLVDAARQTGSIRIRYGGEVERGAPFRESGGGHIGWDGLMDRVQIRRICVSDRARRRGPALFRIGPTTSAVQLEAGPAEDTHRNRDSCDETRVETAVVATPDSSSAPPSIPCIEIPRAPSLSASPNAIAPPPPPPPACLVCARGNAPVEGQL